MVTIRVSRQCQTELTEPIAESLSVMLNPEFDDLGAMASPPQMGVRMDPGVSVRPCGVGVLAKCSVQRCTSITLIVSSCRSALKYSMTRSRNTSTTAEPVARHRPRARLFDKVLGRKCGQLRARRLAAQYATAAPTFELAHPSCNQFRGRSFAGRPKKL